MSVFEDITKRIGRVRSSRTTSWRFALYVAFRYLFSKKSHNAINVISGISMGGVAVGTFALVCVLSVLNGFEGLVKASFCTFDPELKITVREGKSFSTALPAFDALKSLSGVAYVSEIVQESGLVAYDNRQVPALIKGVDSLFVHVAAVDKSLLTGAYALYTYDFPTAILGAGVAYQLSTGVDYVNPVVIYAPKRGVQVNLQRPDAAFVQERLYTGGVFLVNQPQYDDQMVLVPLEFARYLYGYQSDRVTSLELKLAPGVSAERVEGEIERLLGDAYLVQNQYEQQEDFYRIMQVEKWITFLILAFILLIATFNVIGSLSMLMIEKRGDIQVLYNLGATQRVAERIFLLEGWMISIAGAVAGIVLGLIVCYVQIEFGLLKLGAGMMTENYPVIVQGLDILFIFITVLLMGFVSAYYPVSQLKKR